MFGRCEVDRVLSSHAHTMQGFGVSVSGSFVVVAVVDTIVEVVGLSHEST